MKNLGTSAMMAVACLLAPFGAMAADLVVPRGETVVISESVVYDTVTVSGTVRIESTGKLKAANFNLGPNAGDAALVEVPGSADCSLYVTGKMTIGGAEGGCGLVRAMNTAQNNTGWNKVNVLSIVNLTVAAGAASTGEFLDIVELGAGTLDMKNFENLSAIRARIRVKDGRIGNTQFWGMTFFTGKFQIEAYDADSTIRFGASYSVNQMGNDLVVKSFGRDFVVVGAANPGNSEQVLKVGKGVVWDGVRNIVLKGYGNAGGGDGASGRLSAGGNDVLPYGAGAGILRLEGKENFLNLDAGFTIHLNGLDDASRIADRWCGTLRAGESAKVVFGAGDVDGVLNGWIDAKVAVEKSGTGTLTVERASKAGTITVKAGTLAVNAPLAVEALSVEAGAVLRIDGQTIRTAKPGKIEGEVQLLNGAQLVSEYEVAADVREANVAYGSRMEKTGAGMLIVENPASMHPSLAVKEGTVAFSGAGYDVDLFKFRLVDLSWYETGRFFSLAEIAIADLDGKVVSKGIGQASEGTLPGQLAPGKAIFSADWIRHEASNTSWGEVALFDLEFYSTGDVKLESFGDGKDVSVYFRLPAGSIPVAGYDFSIGAWGVPTLKKWEISGSPDNGETWIPLDARTVSGNAEPQRWQTGVSIQSMASSSTLNPAYKLHSADLRLARPGVENMPAAMQVRVDGGATLDFTNVTGGQTVDGLEFDATRGAGRLVNAKIAEAGAVNVTGVADKRELYGLELPVDWENCAGLGNLRGWSVSVNGVPVEAGKIVCAYYRGSVRFIARGMVIMVR